MTQNQSAASVGATFVAMMAIACPAAGQSGAGTLQLSSNDGRRQVVAIELTTPVTVDGRLNEEVWSRARPADGFVQAEPLEGQPATETTEVRLAFDRENLYIAALCHDSDPSGPITNEIRKDFVSRDQDTFEVLLDTFADRRNGFVFITNAAGAKADAQMANEGREANADWDAVWWVATQVTAGAWSAEMRIPFKTLRFEPGAGRVWGVNFARRIRRKNEIVYWSQVTRAYSIFRASLGGNLVGLPDVSQGRNLRIKPFLLGGAVRTTGGRRYDADRGIGVDVKYGVTPALTLDLTVKPDFAQAEADEQQVNLTQFSLFFPEKREFFLENSGTFYFGDVPRNRRVSSRFRPPEEEVLVFFSRRIGLTDEGEQIPLSGGARLTGRAGGFGVGAMTLQSETTPTNAGNNYSVFRVRRDILGNSDAGGILLSRQSARDHTDYNRVAGFDANFRFYQYLSLNSFLARSFTPGVSDGQMAGKSSIGWEDNLTHLQYSLLSIGDNFRDDLGFVRRVGIRKHFADAGLRPRPELLTSRGIREIHPHLRVNYFTDQRGEKVTVQNHIGFQIMHKNGAWVELVTEPRFERIDTPFRVRRDVPIPVGEYSWKEYQLVVETDHSRKLSGSARLIGGGFWSGTQRSVLMGVLYRPNYRLVFDLGLQRNDIRLEKPQAGFVTTLLTLRSGYAFNTQMFLDSLVQYRSDLRQFSANIRFNLIHRPLSDFFIVYNEAQLLDRQLTPGRGLVVKYTHMLAF